MSRAIEASRHVKSYLDTLQQNRGERVSPGTWQSLKTDHYRLRSPPLTLSTTLPRIETRRTSSSIFTTMEALPPRPASNPSLDKLTRDLDEDAALLKYLPYTRATFEIQNEIPEAAPERLLYGDMLENKD
jgi:hypothetical protein